MQYPQNVAKFLNFRTGILSFYAFYSKLSALRSLLSTSHSFTLHEPCKYFRDVIKVDVRNAGINTDEEGVVHNEIRVRQVPRNAMGNVLICGMTQEIAAEEVSGLDAVGFQECGQGVAGKTGLFSHRDNITEPGGIGVLRGPGQDETVFAGFQNLGEFLEILLALGDESPQLFQLSAANGCLHICNFEIISNVTIDIFVIVAEG